MRSGKDGIVWEVNFIVDGQVLETVIALKFHGSLMPAVGGVEAEVQQRVLVGSKVLGTVRSV